MRIGLIGRTQILIDTAHHLLKEGHEIVFIYTSKSEKHYGIVESDFEVLAKKIGCPFFCDTEIHENGRRLGETGAEVCVSVNWLTILREELLKQFKFGILNAHIGDLPRYKGNACPNWALLNFEKTVTVTIHKMVEQLDSGPFFLKEHLDIDESTYIGDIYRWAEERIPKLFVKTLQLLPSHKGKKQDENIRSLRTFPRKRSDSRIHWDNNTRDILALIRASSVPFAGAYSFTENGTEVIIFRAKVYLPDFDFKAIPGQICLANQGNPVVATSDGMIEIQECKSKAGDSSQTKASILSSLRNRLM